MSWNCVVPGCSTIPQANPKKGRLKKSIFKFPLKNEKLLKIWISNIPRDFSNFSFSNSGTRICEDHFEDQYKIKSESGKFVRLADGAVPTIFEGAGEDVEAKSANKNTKITDYSDACRFCLMKISDCRIEIDENLKYRFENLTQLELKSSAVYSSHICTTCNRNIEYAYKFRTKLVVQQTKLYNALQGFEDKPEEYFQNRQDIKEEDTGDPELDNFLDVNLEIKSEPDENNFEDENDDNIDVMWEKPMRKSKKRSHDKYSGSRAFDFPKIQDRFYEDDEKEDWNFDEFYEHASKKSKKTEKQPKSENQKSYKKITTICPECGISITSVSLDRHIRRKHSDNESKFICDFCGYLNAEKPLLRKHILLNHSKERNFQCPECGKKFATPASLKIHIQQVHRKDERPEQKCLYCDKKFKLKYYMDIHIQQVHFNKPKYICECGESFTHKRALRIHKEKHDMKKYDCEDCTSVFYSETEYKLHRKSRHQKPYKCDQCFKSFLYRGQLHQHIKAVHEGIRDHLRSYCEKAYPSKKYLDRHIIEFHMNIKVHCEVPGCKSSFARKETYRKHVLTHHKDLGEPRVQDLLMKIRELKIELSDTMKPVR